jgi:hypothetical protein
LVGKEGRLGGWKIRVKGKERVRSGGGLAGLEDCDRMGNSDRER